MRNQSKDRARSYGYALQVGGVCMLFIWTPWAIVLGVLALTAGSVIVSRNTGNT